MAWTQEDLDALDLSIKAGTLIVRHGETSVQYRSLDEMLRIRALIAAEVSPTTAPRRTVVKYSSGVR